MLILPTSKAHLPIFKPTSQFSHEAVVIIVFMYMTSSRNYPQSDRLVQDDVKLAKQLMEKTKRDNIDPYLALLNVRNVPSDSVF